LDAEAEHLLDIWKQSTKNIGINVEYVDHFDDVLKYAT
jgi:hypothetical protein